MHDRYLSGTPNSKMSTTEAFHWCKSLTLFNSKLSRPVQHSERDALWATTIFTGMTAFYFVEAKTPEEAWPLSRCSPAQFSSFSTEVRVFMT